MSTTIATYVRQSRTFPHSGLANTCKLGNHPLAKGDPVLFVLKKYTVGGYKKQAIVCEECFNEREEHQG